MQLISFLLPIASVLLSISSLLKCTYRGDVLCSLDMIDTVCSHENVRLPCKPTGWHRAPN